MVEDRVTNGKRIAQLLASELDGREDGSLDRVTVVNAREAVESSEGGTRAYNVAVDNLVVASVSLHPDRAEVAFVDDVETALGAAESAGLGTRRESRGSGESPRSGERSGAAEGSGSRGTSGQGVVVSVESGAEVKRAIDVVIAVASTV